MNLLDASKGGIVFGESVKKSLESKILEMYEATSLDKLIKIFRNFKCSCLYRRFQNFKCWKFLNSNSSGR
jgi:hypothetical protein